MRLVRLRIFLRSLLVDRQMAGLAPIHLRHTNEIHVVDDVGQNELLHLDGGRKEVDERCVEDVIFESAWGDGVELFGQPIPLGSQLPDLLRDARRVSRVLSELLLQVGLVGVELFELQIEPRLPGALRRRPSPAARGRTSRRSSRTRTRSDPGRTSPSLSDSRWSLNRSGLVEILSACSAGRRPSAGLRQPSWTLPVPGPSGAEAWRDSTERLACCSCACVTWVARFLERRCVRFPSRLVVIPDHPDDDRNRKRLHARKTTSESPRCGVPDALLFKPDGKCDLRY